MAKKRPFAVFDIDGTLIRWQLYHAIADELVKLGHISPNDFAAIKEARMVWKRREHSESFREYEEKLVGLYSRALVNLSFYVFTKAAGAVFDEYKDQAYTYTRDLIKELKAKGYLLFAISGSQTEIVEKIASHYGFDDFVGTVFAHEGDKFTGQITAPLGKKHEVLQNMINKHNAESKGSVGVGDSTGDISMLELVEKPVAFNPEQKLFNHAKKMGWTIILERKNMVYELEEKNGRYYLV